MPPCSPAMQGRRLCFPPRRRWVDVPSPACKAVAAMMWGSCGRCSPCGGGTLRGPAALPEPSAPCCMPRSKRCSAACLDSSAALLTPPRPTRPPPAGALAPAGGGGAGQGPAPGLALGVARWRQRLAGGLPAVQGQLCVDGRLHGCLLRLVRRGDAGRRPPFSCTIGSEHRETTDA